MNPPEAITASVDPDAAHQLTWGSLPAPPPARSRWAGLRDPLLLAGVGIAGATYLWFNNPNASTSIYPPCPLKYFTGLDCPGCGMTRALYSLMHGDLLSALSHNMFFVIALPFIVWAFVRWGAAKVGYELPPLVRPRPWMGWAFALTVVAFGIVRNLPLPGIEWLGSS